MMIVACERQQVICALLGQTFTADDGIPVALAAVPFASRTLNDLDAPETEVGT